MRIAADLDGTGVRELQAALSDRGAEDALSRREDRRGGVRWRIDLGRAERPEPLLERLADLGEPAARMIRRIAPEGAVSVSLCQEIGDVDDPGQKGIWFAPEAVRWAALAGASVDIDQYIYTD
ncbi:hypothetical protein [Nocardiopsis composta]|uniref:DUF4279 domain-containing protein n=1 Tax=Nocardiopsis composta TaxID=157465 RepID=A0A7W8QM83_9ACTN|nr:hypothetical protein [Nocardiopsis composta]MBB5432375.1 hypothetical protein [Nocardiopsis composta]